MGQPARHQADEAARRWCDRQHRLGRGQGGFPGLATYCATKHAVVGLSESLSLEYEPAGISVVCVMPGMVNTELISGLDTHWLLKPLNQKILRMPS